jgi:beta-barrel assembly-enhancing protease
MTTPASRLLPCVLALALALTGLPAPAQNRLPALGDTASEYLDLGAELRLGEDIMGGIRRDPAYLDDPVLLHYVDGLWRPLVESARRLGHIGPETERLFPWELFLVRDASVNAFALPGGHVGVHLGLIAMTDSADELASVLAHELTHVTQRHIARSIGSAQQTSMVGLAAMLLGMLIAARAGSADAAQAAVMSGQGAMMQGQLNFSRDMEREADRIGFGMLDDAGFAPYGMASMFEKLDQANRLNDSGAFPYLRSHPLTSARIAEARARVPATAAAPAGSGLHALMRVRATALMDPTTATLRRLQQAPVEVDDPAQALVGWYRRALASSRLEEPDAAREAMTRALAAAERPGTDPAVQQAVHWLAAEVWLAQRQGARALALLDASARERPALLLRAQAVRAAAGNGDATPPALRRSVEVLQTWVAEHPRDAAAWSELARSATLAGLPLRAQRAEAEASLLGGDLAGAVDRLRVAQRGAIVGGPEAIELQVIDARLRTLEARLREQRREELQRAR